MATSTILSYFLHSNEEETTHAPKIKRCIKLHKTPWWDVQCQVRKERRRAERALKKNNTQSNKFRYSEICIKAKQLFREKKSSYSTKLLNSYGDANKTYVIVNQLLDKQCVKTLKLDELIENL